MLHTGGVATNRRALLVTGAAAILLSAVLASPASATPVTPSFASYPDPPTVADGATRVATGDFDDDGNLDVAANRSAASLSVLYGNGNGGFPQAASSISLPGPARALAVGDFSGDGIDDVASFVAIGGGNAVATSLGSMDGLSAPGTSVAVDAENASGLAAGKLDGDADLDLVATTFGAGTTAVPLLNDGSGGFTAGTAVIPGCEGFGNLIFDVAVADVDGDAKPDAVVSCALEMGVLLGDGDGGLGSPQRAPIPV
jgi:hypothetical protein